VAANALNPEHERLKAVGSSLAVVGLLASIALPINLVIKNINLTEAWGWSDLLTLYGALLAGLFGVGVASSTVVRVLARPRAKDNRDWFSRQLIALLPALLLALVVIVAVEGLVRGYAIPLAQIPPPSAVLAKLWEARIVLWRDTQITLLETFVGFVIGGGLGVLTAILTQRFKFLELGLMPYATLFSSIPIVALAPVVIKAMGVDWQSKAVVVGITVFFPMLLNTARGLKEVNPLQLDLMRSYAATSSRVFLDLRIPSAMPFIFNGLKTGAVLGLISAIVAEFFGANGAGLGFRIVVEIGTASLDTVWAAIVIASALGISVYNLLALLEHRFTAWHSSFREEN
jgi:NitT/TauT family transport system permease protein